ncbi:YVTN family beta-propeller protein [Spirosoma oryzae]|uniref:YVTN family beta-propeller protein n=1 Tax=Spirosoma oryzae TaxID=1469603 RepID=A0A2T0SNN3_9BACT|nr:YncE family protein [Spirosoma oryzae]PRY34973.1 YVTN family beta-propeller protein [Spirosoma oryzae]
MRYFILLLVTSLLTGCDHKLDPTLPGDTNPVMISSLDRVYTADQSSNTVSVIDPSTDKLLGQIKFGTGRPDHLSPLYNHEVNVHGLGVSPDNRYLAVVSTLTNSVSFVDLMTNLVSMKTYVGRNPHEGFFSPDGKQYWLAVRGENYVSVIDMSTQQEIRRVVTANGPSMVVFRPDGLVAFVNHSFTAEIDVIDTKTYQVIKRVPVVSPFSPNLAATFDGNQVWFTHKDVGKVSVLNARTYEIEGVIDTGPGTNHVNFAGPDGGTRYSGSAAGAFAYVTVGGENAVKVYSRDRQLVSTIPTGPNPHGVWPSGDGSKVYVGLENGDAVDVIDTKTNTKRTEIASGQAPQALIYVVKAVPPPATGLTNLVPLASGPPLNVRLSPVGTPPVPGVGGGVTLRTIDGVDEAILMLKKLAPTTTYTLYLSDQKTVAVNPEAVLSFTTDDQGAVETYAYYQIKLRLTGRYMLVLQGDKNPAAAVVLSTP